MRLEPTFNSQLYLVPEAQRVETAGKYKTLKIILTKQKPKSIKILIKSSTVAILPWEFDIWNKFTIRTWNSTQKTAINLSTRKVLNLKDRFIK